MRWLLLGAMVVGCDEKAAMEQVDGGAEIFDDGPNFYADILPIMGEKCQQCHNSTDPMGSAFPLETYEQVSAFAPVLLNKMRPEGDSIDPFFMPPFNARSEEDCEPQHQFRGTYHVEPDEVDRFEAWINNDTPEGDPAAIGPYAVPSIIGLDGTLTEMGFAEPYTVPPPTDGAYDSFRCFAMQMDDGAVAVSTERWLNGLSFSPGNAAVAHHMLLFAVPNLATHMERGLIEDESTNSWECSGAVSRADGRYDLQNFSLMWGWVPGGLPLDLTEGMGMRLGPNTGLVVQMHYNTLADPEDLTDASILNIREMNEVPRREAGFSLFGVAAPGATDAVDDPPFEVPFGSKGHKETYTERVDRFSDGVRVWGFIPHMHLAGTAIRMRLGGEDGDRCLVNIPRYDYNWQQMYAYDAKWDELPTLKEGDALRVECTYDNSSDNVMLKKYLGGPVEDGVRLGNGTSDEMCLVGLAYACEGRCG